MHTAGMPEAAELGCTVAIGLVKIMTVKTLNLTKTLNPQLVDWMQAIPAGG